MRFRVIFACESASRAAPATARIPSRTRHATWLTIVESAADVHQSKTKGGISEIAVRFR
jgi:hypothetical protein